MKFEVAIALRKSRKKSLVHVVGTAENLSFEFYLRLDLLDLTNEHALI